MYIHFNVGMHLWYLQETLNASIAELTENADSKFVTICHGEPWSGNIQYRYSSYVVVDSSSNPENGKDGEGKSPVEAVFGGINYIIFRAYIGRNKNIRNKKSQNTVYILYYRISFLYHWKRRIRFGTFSINLYYPWLSNAKLGISFEGISIRIGRRNR